MMEHFEEEDRYRDYTEGDLLDNSDLEEIEQALYAQIHYCQDNNSDAEDGKHLDSFTERDHVNTDKFLEKNYLQSQTINTRSLSCDGVLSAKTLKTKKKNNCKTTKSAKTSLENLQKNVIVIESEPVNTVVIDSSEDLNSLSSDDSDILCSSDSDSGLESDCMMLDQTIPDMGNIVINIDKNQRQMVENLTLKQTSDIEETGDWLIEDRDRFRDNPLLKRYYKTISVRCHNCNEVGHLSKVCPKPKKIIICYLCADEGHCGKNCLNPICHNCDKPGHKSSDCSVPWRSRRIDCHRCYMLGHTSSKCPELWRQFHLTTEDNGQLVRNKKPEKKKENSTRSCSNCAGNDHFYFECEEDRMDRYTPPSYPFICEYRKSDISALKRHNGVKLSHIKIDKEKIPIKRMKVDNDFKRSHETKNCETDFKRNNENLDNESISKKNKKKLNIKVKKKVDKFRTLMENDDVTFKDRKNICITVKNRKKKKDTLSHYEETYTKKMKRKKSEVEKRKNNFQSLNVKMTNPLKNKAYSGIEGRKKSKNNITRKMSLEEQYYGPIKQKKKKKKNSKKSNKDPANQQGISKRGFVIRNGQFKITV